MLAWEPKPMRTPFKNWRKKQTDKELKWNGSILSDVNWNERVHSFFLSWILRRGAYWFGFPGKQQQYRVVQLGLGLNGLKCGLGRRASWAVHGWCMASVHGSVHGAGWVGGGVVYLCWVSLSLWRHYWWAATWNGFCLFVWVTWPCDVNNGWLLHEMDFDILLLLGDGLLLGGPCSDNLQ